MASHPFQTQLLIAFPLVIFPKWVDSFLPGWKSSQLLPFMVLHSGFPEGPLAHELLFSKLSGCFLHHWMANRYVSILVPCVSWHSFWAILISSWLCCTSQGSRAPGYSSPILTTRLPSDFLTLADWTSFLLPFVSWILRPIYSWVWVLP